MPECAGNLTIGHLYDILEENMGERKERKEERPQSLFELERRCFEVVAVRHRSLEYFLRVFQYTPENVINENLGTIVGVFSIDASRNEEVSDVVSAIASVVKKEYFSIRRRTASESFETTLHKVNLMLTEFVKNGNVRWLGHLHGSIAAIEKNRIHFSATGDGILLLIRNGVAINIGEGLSASDAATHPLKTFTEISTGRLEAGDKLLLASPSLGELFSGEQLARVASRMDPEHFAQYLGTACINELPLCGAIAVDMSLPEPKEPPTPVVHRQPVGIGLGNVFSGQTFKKKESGKRVARSTIHPQSESVDTETNTSELASSGNDRGHIYIQGSDNIVPDRNPFVEQTLWAFDDFLHGIESLFTKARRSLRISSQSLAQSTVTSLRQIGMSVASVVRISSDKLRTSSKNIRIAPPEDTSHRIAEDPPSLTPSAPITPPIISKITGAAKSFRFPTLSYPTFPLSSRFSFRNLSSVIPSRMPSDIRSKGLILNSERIRQFFHRSNTLSSLTSLPTQWFSSVRTLISARSSARFKISPPVVPNTMRDSSSYFSEKKDEWWRSFFETITDHWHILHPRTKRKILLGTATGIVALGSILFFIFHTTVPVPPSPIVEEPTPAPAFPPTEEPNAVLVTPETHTGNDIVTSVFLRGTLYTITRSSVVDTINGTVFPTPTSDIIAATPMDTINTIFLLTDAKKIYSFTPSNKVFAENAIALPTDASIHSIGSFLTYLYLFDKTSQQILRYPRATGGFGNGKNWLTTHPNISDINHLAVSENIYLASSSDVSAFTKGKPVPNFNFEKPATPLTITALCANPNAPDTFVILDAPAKRFLVYSSTGALIHQYFSEDLTNATACALSQDSTSMVSTSTTATLLFKIP